MGEPAGVVFGAVGAFVGTNVDDLLLLCLLIVGMPIDLLKVWQVVLGQYVGFVVLLVVAGVAVYWLHGLSGRWIGLLGFLPIGMGLLGFVRAARGGDRAYPPVPAAGVVPVAVVTVANGGDNVAVYSLLFRGLDVAGLVLTTAVFLVLLGVWCRLALLIVRRGRLVPTFVRTSEWLTPSVLVVIGLVVLLRSGAVGL